MHMHMRLQAGLRSAAAVAIVAASAWIPLLIQASPVDAATHAHVTMGRHSTIIRIDDSQDPDPGADSSATDGSDSPTDEPTAEPTDDPTDAPTDDPTDDPTDLSTSRDSQGSDAGSSSSNSATDGATDGASDGATDAPTDEPTDAASDEPTDSATDEPTDSPNDASSADGQGSNQSSGNPGEPSGADIAANGAAAIADGGIFGGGQGSSTHITLGVVVGARAAGAPVDIDVQGFTPGSTLTLTVRSTPVVIGTAVVPDTGVVSLHGVLPSDLEPGVHQVIVTDEGGTAPGAMVLLNLDDQGMVTAIAPQGDIPSESTNTSLLARALDLGKPLYNSLAHPATVAAAAITGAAVAGVAGSMGGASAAGSGARSGG
ncbi:MAG: PT domain-containing protein, partial [Actinomycetes bacterium]